jgi:RNA polymerase sigma factor (sigma-70 family)
MVIEWKLREHFAGRTIFVVPPDWDPEAADPYAGFEDRYDFLLFIADLPEKTRRIVELRYLGGLEIEDIAESLGMTRNAVDQALHRGRVALGRKVGG